MLERVSPLSRLAAAHGMAARPFGMLTQYHAWPDRFGETAARVAGMHGAAIPAPGRAVRASAGALLRIHPQRLWHIAESESGPQEDLPPELGVSLDLSHARTIIHVDASVAEPLLSRFVGIDLRPEHFAVDAVALAPLHRVAVVLWNRSDGIDVLAPRSFAASIWNLLSETAERLQ
jgi:heterotetrameric sarcosine oxidase gamma subunit